jgi:glycerol-3-phosphate dehydrogenase
LSGVAVRRNLSPLADTTFDLLVVGAGIHGACAAWDATLRGLSVAVVDRDDFGAATSANSLRIVHGGLRYLARSDIPRTMESIHERTALLRIAPALVEPLPVLVPTHGNGLRSRTAYRAALAVNDLVSVFRNRGLESDRMIPRGRVVSREACLALFPAFSSVARLTGGALWHDARLRHPERLVLSFLRSAADQGAVPANYLRVNSLRTRSGAVEGAAVTDQVTGEAFEIRARAVLVAAGPWTNELIAGATGRPSTGPARSHALGVNVVLKRRLADIAVGVQALSGRDQDPVCGGRRYLFLAPSGNTTVLGTWYAMSDRADPRSLVDRGARTLVQELNQACPGIPLGPEDILRHHWGWLPLKGGLETGRPGALAERPRVVDHAPTDGIRHLYSVEGVKYTTARRVAQQAVDLVFHGMARRSPACRTSQTPLNTGPTAAGSEVLQAVQEEMAIRLADVVFRRTDLGAAPGPDQTTARAAAHQMGVELGWDAHRQEAEVEDVMRQAGVPGPALEAVG